MDIGGCTYSPEKPTESYKMKPDSGHYYKTDGTPCHFVPRASGTGERPTTVADAKKLGLLPSPTTVLKVLSKPALTEWLIRNAVHAFATAPDVAGETLDEKLARVLETERQQDQESRLAMDLGTRVHEAIELTLNDVEVPEWTEEIAKCVHPVIDALRKLGRVVATERIVVGRGCAGKTDCIVDGDDWFHVVDFKTAKKLPEKDAWPEHRMQVGFYASALGNTGDKKIATTIVYISTAQPGQMVAFTIFDWQKDYAKFELLLKYWYLSNQIELPQ